MNSRGRAAWLEPLLVFVGMLAWSVRPIWDIDIFWHIAIGREVFAHGVPHHDLFSSATPNAPWMPFQLGYALLVAWLDHALGLYGVNLVHALGIAAGSAGFYVLARKHTESRAAAWILFSVFVLMFDERIRPRPHVVNLLFECFVLLPLALQTRVPRTLRDTALCFVVGAAWGFFHSMGALWLCATLGTYVVASPEPQVRRHALHATIASFAGIFVTPTNFAAMRHVSAIQGQWKEFVPELATSFSFASYGGIYGPLLTLVTLAAGAAVAYALAQKPPHARWPTLLVAAGMAFSAIWLCRLSYYAAFVLLLLWPELTRGASEARGLLRERNLYLVSAALLTVLIAHVLPRYVQQRMSPWTHAVEPLLFPVQETAALHAAHISGPCFNETRWGGFILYRLFPEVRVLTDGRITWSPEVSELLRSAAHYPPEVFAEVAYQRFGIDLLIWQYDRMPPNEHWQVLLEGPVAQVWSRSGAVLEKRRALLAKAGVPQRIAARRR